MPAVLLARPRPVPGENIAGYLRRVALANGFGSVGQLRHSLKVRSQGALDELYDRLQLSAAERRYPWGCLPRSWGGPTAPLELEVGDFNHQSVRWCPVCLQEDTPLMQGYLGLKLACVCIQHSTWLQDSCERCAIGSSWSEVQVMQCPCSAASRKGAGVAAPQPVIALTQLLSGQLTQAVAPGWPNLSPRQAHRLVRYLGQFQRNVKPEHPGQVAFLSRLSVARIHVEGTAALLSDWPGALHQWMARLQEVNPHSSSVRRTFAPLYGVLYDDLREECFDFLRAAFESYLQEHWWGLVCRRNRRLNEQTLAQHPRVTLEQAARTAGTAAATVRHLVQGELIASVSAPLPSGREIRTVHVQDLNKLKEWTEGALNLRQAAQQLQLPEKRLRDLIAHKVICPLVHGPQAKAASWVIARKDVARLFIQASSSAQSDTENVRRILRYWMLSAQEGVAFIEALLEGAVTAYCSNVRPVPVGAAAVHIAEARAWLQKRRSEHRIGLSVDQAARTLGIKQEVAYGLVRSGLLGAIHMTGMGYRVMPEDIDRFRTTYVSLADLSRERRTSPRALLPLVDAQAVCGPSVDGQRQYFFARSALLHLKAIEHSLKGSGGRG